MLWYAWVILSIFADDILDLRAAGPATDTLFVDIFICREGEVEYEHFITSTRCILILYLHLCFDLKNLLSWTNFLNRSLYYWCLHHVSHLQNWLEPWLSDNRTEVGEGLPSGRSADQCQATVLGVHTDPLPLSVVAPLLSACLCLQTHGLICKKSMCSGFHCKLLSLTLW